MSVCLFVTANLGSIFEDPNGLLKIWVKEFLQTVSRLEPKFIALHCQEFGGKNYEASMIYVNEFVRTLLSSNELLDFEQIRAFLDEDYKANDKFTALGNIYLVHKTQEAFIWDFNDQLFVPVFGKEIHSGNIENVAIKDKLKFPQDFFPECKWSRKGFMRTRWLINGVAFDLVNIHLFHDESNFVSISESPSPYSKNRRKALEYTLELIGTSSFKELPQFIFGDFNFRLDTQSMVQRLTNNARPTQILASNGDLSRLIYRDSHSIRHLLVERKQFMYSDPKFFPNPRNIDSLLELDKELSQFEGLSELKIAFPPSYPFKEDLASSGYMNTRCPSWCDRILMNKFAQKLVFDNSSLKAKYEMMGYDVPMGDHKPVYLLFRLMPNRESIAFQGQVLTLLLSHRNRKSPNGIKESDRLSVRQGILQFDQSPSSHLNPISFPSPFESISGVCTANGQAHRLPPSLASLKPIEQNHQSMADLAATRGIPANQTCSIFLTASKSKTDCLIKNDNLESLGQNGTLPQIANSSFGRLKRYCLCCIL